MKGKIIPVISYDFSSLYPNTITIKLDKKLIEITKRKEKIQKIIDNINEQQRHS